MGSTDSIAALARPLLAEVGLELWDLEVSPSLVRILVDRDGGIDLDALAAATRALSPVLDDHDDLLPVGPYDLEVSSPGIERTLRTLEQYRRYVGSTLNVKTTVAVGGARRFRATLVGVGAETVDLAVEGSSTPMTVALDHIERARTVLEWGPTPKSGAKPGSGKPGSGKPGSGKPGSGTSGEGRQAARQTTPDRRPSGASAGAHADPAHQKRGSAS